MTVTTDDGKPASAFYLTSILTALPAGWSSASKTLSCGSVSTGNGCQLPLTYAPAALDQRHAHFELRLYRCRRYGRHGIP